MRPPAASRATVVRDRPRDPAKTAAFAKSGLPFLVSSNNGCHFRPVAPIAQPLVEPVESQLRRLEPLSILPAQSPEELALFDLIGFCGVIIICLTAEHLVRTSNIWLLIVTLVPWLACFTEPRRGSWQFVTSSSAGVEPSAKPTCATLQTTSVF